MDGIIEMHEVLHLAQIKNMEIFLLKLDMQKIYKCKLVFLRHELWEFFIFDNLEILDLVVYNYDFILCFD